MPVRCPACHSDQTKPAPARNFLERLGGLLGRRAYFCEDCYRRFTPSAGASAPPDEEPEPDIQGPELAEPMPEALGETPPPAVTMGIPQAHEEDSLISRMKRRQLEDSQEDDAPASEGSRLPLFFSPAKLAGLLGAGVLVIMLILWYRSSLDQPPPPSQPPTTRVKIGETTPPARLESGAGPSATATPLPSEPAPGPGQLAPASQAPASPAPPAPQAITPPPEIPTPPPAPALPAPPRPSAQPAPAKKPPVAAKARPPVAKTSPAKPSAQGNYAVQFGAFSQAPRAQALAAKLQAKGLKVQVVTTKGRDGKVWHKVRSGPLASHGEAQRVQRKLEQASGIKAMVVRLKP